MLDIENPFAAELPFRPPPLGTATPTQEAAPSSLTSFDHLNADTSVSTVPSPDAVVKGLIAAIDALQLQQARAEAARHAADADAADAAAEGAALEAALHVAMRCVAELDDSEQEVQAALDARLQEQAALEEQLRLASRRLSSLRAEVGPPGDAGGSGAHLGEGRLQRELHHKQEIADELQRRLLAQGLGASTLAQLCADAEAAAHSSVDGGGSGGGGPSSGVGRAASMVAGSQKSGWLGGAGAAGLLSGFVFRRRGSTGS